MQYQGLQLFACQQYSDWLSGQSAVQVRYQVPEPFTARNAVLERVSMQHYELPLLSPRAVPVQDRMQKQELQLLACHLDTR